MEYYELKICGVTRQLPICPLNEKIDIAGFVMFSDVELTVLAAKALIERIPKCDMIITAESKGIPLAYEMAKQLGVTYLVARKGEKAYMSDPVSVNVHSITTKGEQRLILDRSEAQSMSGKDIVIADDVISTGESLAAVEKLVTLYGGRIVARCAVLAEGDAVKRDDIIFLEELPLFFK